MADPEVWQALINTGNPYYQQGQRNKGLAEMLAIEKAQRGLQQEEQLQQLFARSQKPTPSEVGAAMPSAYGDYVKSQYEAQKQQQELDQAHREYNASVFGPIAERAMIRQQQGDKDWQRKYNEEMGTAASGIVASGGQLPNNFDSEKHDPLHVLTNSMGFKYKSPYMENTMAVQREQSMRGLNPAEPAEHYWGTNEKVERNPITHDPEIMPGTTGRRGKLGKQAPMEDFTDYNIADEQGNLVSFSPENLPKLKDLYQKIENPNVKSKLGIYISQVQQGGQLPTAKGVTAEEKAAFAKEEAKGRKVGEAEATREIQHEKMTSAFDEQHLKDLINKSTPGGVAEYGTMATKAATLSTPWSKADTQLGIDAAALLQSVPRFEGPQSDSDRASYEKAAGNLANPSIPRGDRIAAVNEMKRLLDKYEIKYGKESNLDEAVKGRRKAALDMLDKGEIDEAQFKTMWDQK